MNIVHLTPGAGGMYCGNCFRDNALVAALRKLGHETLMVPLYLPMTIDEPDESAGTPIFFSGINVYLDQKAAWYRSAPHWLHGLMTSRRLLKWASGRAAKTRAADLGDLTLSMLRGEEGNQARELDELIAWLKTHGRTDVICLSNALLLAMARRLRRELGAPVVCALQGEDTFLDALPESYRAQCWKLLSDRANDAELFIAPSRYFGRLMGDRLGLPPEKVRVVFNGINLADFESRSPKSADQSRSVPALGYFARMCREKGLHTLVETYIALRKRGGVKELKLRIGGSCGPSDEPFVESLRGQLREAGLLADVEFRPNLSRAEKVDFFRSLDIFSVPALYGEAFGLYVIEALAAGVPVVQPRHGAFPELIEATGGGIICEPDAESLATAIEELALNPERARSLGEAGRKAVLEKFTAETMANEMLQTFESARAGGKLQGAPTR